MLIPEPNFRSSVFIHLFSTFSCIIFILLMIYNYSNYFPMYLPIYSYNSILVSAFFSSASIYSGKGSPIWHSPHMSTPIIFLSFKKEFQQMFKHTKAHMPLTPVSFNIMFVQNIFVYGNIKGTSVSIKSSFSLPLLFRNSSAENVISLL